MGTVEKKLKEVLAFAACLWAHRRHVQDTEQSSDAHGFKEHNGQDLRDAPCELNG